MGGYSMHRRDTGVYRSQVSKPKRMGSLRRKWKVNINMNLIETVLRV
jgi:hypothetical protein